MKADIPKEERQRREREQWAEIRAALVRNHFQIVQDQTAIDATMARLEVEHLTQAAPAIYAAMGRARTGAEPVVTSESEPVAPPDPASVAARPSAPDLPFDLRHHLGLR